MWRYVSVCYRAAITKSQTEGLKQQKFTSSQFWRLEVQDQDLPRAMREGSVPGLSPWLMDSSLVTVCLHIVFLLYGSVSKFPVLIRTPVKSYWIKAHPNDLIST